MRKNKWKRLLIYEWVTIFIFLSSLFLFILNKDYIKSMVLEQLFGYLFWLSLGLYLGFQWCKKEFVRIIKRDEEIQRYN
jgi:hypothetical protein